MFKGCDTMASSDTPQPCSLPFTCPTGARRSMPRFVLNTRLKVGQPATVADTLGESQGHRVHKKYTVSDTPCKKNQKYCCEITAI